MAALTITDNATTPTGVTATVSGSSGGANSVYVQAVTGQVGSGAWVLGGTRTGDGTVPLSLSRGYYFAYCLTAPATLSGLAYVAVTDGADAVPARCFAAVKATLQLLDLPFTARVYDHQFDGDLNVTYPCTVLTTEDTRETDEAALNGRDDIGHRVRVLVKDVVAKFDQAKKNTFLAWRQAVTRAFINQRLPGVIESVRNKVEFGPPIVPAGGKPQVVLELVVNCITREVRGLGA